MPPTKPTLIIHGGAGNLSRATVPPTLYAKCHASLTSYLRSTHALLQSGSSALDAAVHAVSLLEDDPLFNCGRGSVFTSAGTIEMEASVMVTSLTDNTEIPGSIKRGAGVIGLKNIRHPIQLARESLLRTGSGSGDNDGGNMHSQLSAPYIEDLAQTWGLESKPDEWFFTQRRWDEHLRGLKGEPEDVVFPQGTVGCVCLDGEGNLAVATSTGGLTNKVPGRVGDTPTLGAGFWAERWDVGGGGMVYRSAGDGGGGGGRGGFWDEIGFGECFSLPLGLFSSGYGGGYEYEALGESDDRLDRGGYRDMDEKSHDEHPPSGSKAVAVSGTGNGDSFLRIAAARTACAMARFSPSMSLSDAVEAVVGPGGELQRSAGGRWGSGEGEGGIIGIEVGNEVRDGVRHGTVVFDFNCGGMWRAWIEDDGGRGVERVMVFREEY